ncbi:RHS repeat protein [Pseudomonas indica]|uniref:RHS repeat protein n=1 Tax=Pseudomonas indica TaxID=137658 RepID=UPI0023F9CB17|nr:RHS repeat protein [Pseudomonas indica]
MGVYQEPGFGANRDFTASEQPDTVDPFTGALKIVIQDLFLPGNGGLDISVVRNYQSVTNDSGPYSNGYKSRTPFGTGWDINFGRLWVSEKFKTLNPSPNNKGCRIGQVASNLNPILELPDGSRHVLVDADSADYAFITKSRWIGRCLPASKNTGAGGLIVISPAGLKYTFNVKGTVSPDYQLLTYFVSRIEDPSGNALSFTYNITKTNTLAKHHVLKSITASDGRSVSFAYADEAGARPILTSVSGGGRTVRYAYVDALNAVGAKAHYLKSVSYPDGTSWSYSYNDRASVAGVVPGRFSMSGMTSPTGLRTVYGYELRQMGTDVAEKLNVITKRTLQNVRGSTVSDHVWTYSYTKGRSPNNDMTLEKGPAQCVRYYHVGPDTIATGTSKVDRGLWKVGLLVKKEIMSAGCGTVLRTETMAWSSQDVAGQNEMRRHNLLVENATRAPLLIQKSIIQNGSTYVTKYAYDSYGQPLKVDESGQKSRITTYSYAAPGANWILGNVTRKNVSGVGDFTYSYTAAGKVLTESKLGVTTSFTYGAGGNMASRTDANGKVTRFEGYFRGVPQKVTYADGTVLTRTVNTTGTVASERDALGRVTSYTYDGRNRLTSITPPKGVAAKTSITYSFGSSGIGETLAKGSYRRVRSYNQLGQLVSQTESGSGPSIVIAARYHPNGQRAFLSNPGYDAAPAQGESFGYDALGRQTAIAHADSSSVTMDYQAGNQVVVTDERGNKTVQKYVSFGEPGESWLAAIVQPGDVQTSLGRDNLGRLTSIVQGGLTRSFAYDGRGFLASETHPETGVTTYAYDAVGNVLSKKVGTAPADTYSYDSRYRLTGTVYGGSGLKLVNAYDAGDRLLSQSFGGTTWSYGYDAHDNLISEKLSTTSPARSYSFAYGYTIVDALASTTYPSGLLVDYAPDALGRPSKAGRFASALAYHPDGTLKSFKYGNGRTLTVSQEPSRLRPSERLTNGADLPMQLRYAYDGANNITQITDLQNSAYSQTLGYDALNRLVAAKGIWGQASYAYNARGDITSQSVAGRSLGYGYDAQGRLSTLSGTVVASLAYDVKGNVLKARGEYGYDQAGNVAWLCYSPRTDCATAPDERYDYDGRQRRVLLSDGKGPQQIHIYGQAGQLLREDHLADGSFAEYVYVAGERIAHQDTCGDVDSDGDGLPDCFEKRHGLDPANPSDGAADSDGDGLSNAEEYRFGTWLNNPDSDNDGLPDGWEVRYGLNANDPGDALGDLDGNGVTNLDSYRRGIPPTNVWPKVLPAINYILSGA